MDMKAWLKQFEPLQRQLRLWWDAREPRERWVLGLLALLVALFLLQLLVWQPMLQARDRARAGYLAARETHLWMQSNATAIRLARQHQASGGDWVADINQSAADAGLALKGFTPQGEQGVRVTLERQPFAALMLWLEQLKQQHGVLPANVDISATQEPGLVNVQLTLIGAG